MFLQHCRPGDYGRRTVKKAEQLPEVQSKRSQQTEEGKSTDQTNRPSRKEAQKNQARSKTKAVAKNRTKKKAKAREKGMSY